MSAALGGLDALVLTAGVGEHSARVRADVCGRLAFVGVELDADLNGRSIPNADVATAESAVRVLVSPPARNSSSPAPYGRSFGPPSCGEVRSAIGVGTDAHSSAGEEARSMSRSKEG